MTDFFTYEEQKIRKRWLISLFVKSGLEFGLLFSTDKPKLLTISELIFNGLLYYFTYKKNGFQFLFSTLLYSLTNIGRILQSKFLIGIDNVADTIALIIGLGFYGWWNYISFKLIKLHESLKPSRKCRKAMAHMQTAQTLGDLDLKFHHLRNSFPKFERSITKDYQEKRDVLINSAQKT